MMTTIKRAARTGLVLLTILLGMGPAYALAKDICVRDSDGGAFVFSKVQTLRPGRVVPLTGFGVVPFPGGRPLAPVHGAAAMGGWDGPHRRAGARDIDHAEPDPQQQPRVHRRERPVHGLGHVDGAGDFRPTSSVTWTSVDCDSIILP